MTLFHYCGCYLSHNIYIKEYNTHFKYLCKDQFNTDYHEILPRLGCDTETKKNILFEKIQEEIDRRKSLEKDAYERKCYLKKFYKAMNPHVHILEEKFLDPQFVKLSKTAKSSNLQKTLELVDVISEEKGIYRFPVFEKEYCDPLLQEINNYSESKMPKGKPNSMNNYGVLLDELGFHDNFSLVLREKYLDSLAQVLFPNWRGDGLDSHKIFTVHYKMNNDQELGYHYDNSEVTLNVCLGPEFEGGELYFGDLNTVPISKSSCVMVPHRVGYGIFHCGRQLHGALPITNGERQNLIFWMRSSTVRNNLCPMCCSKPERLLPSLDYGDGFTSTEVKDNDPLI